MYYFVFVAYCKLIGVVFVYKSDSSDRGIKMRSCSDHSDQSVQPDGNLSFIYLSIIQ